MIVSVEGNVYNPGTISFQEDKRLSYSDYIDLAGGYKDKTRKNRVYVQALNGEIIRLQTAMKKVEKRNMETKFLSLLKQIKKILIHQNL